MSKRKRPRNPDGRNGKPVEIALPFEEALAAALQTPPPPDPKPKRRARKKD